MDKYTSELSASKLLHFENKITKDDVIGMTYDVTKLTMEKGQIVAGYRDWTATHNDLHSIVKVTLKDKSVAYASIFFKYDKTNGVWAGASKRGWLVNGAIAVGNALTPMKHVISDITISRDNIYTGF